eukprot:5098410-Pleurochrysis_carterae.AAC.2
MHRKKILISGALAAARGSSYAPLTRSDVCVTECAGHEQRVPQLGASRDSQQLLLLDSFDLFVHPSMVRSA